MYQWWLKLYRYQNPSKMVLKVGVVVAVVAVELCEALVAGELDVAGLFAVAEHFELQEDAVVELEPAWMDQPMSRGVLR